MQQRRRHNEPPVTAATKKARRGGAAAEGAGGGCALEWPLECAPTAPCHKQSHDIVADEAETTAPHELLSDRAQGAPNPRALLASSRPIMMPPTWEACHLLQGLHAPGLSHQLTATSQTDQALTRTSATASLPDCNE
jgi:hypothetical protein